MAGRSRVLRSMQDPARARGAAHPSVSVIVPSFRRPEHLLRCLAGILRQSRPAEEVIVVRRHNDPSTAAVLEQIAGTTIRDITVSAPGVLCALEAGVKRASGDLFAFTDDDAVPRETWLARLVAAFDGKCDVGAVGGRDVIHTLCEAVGETEHVGNVGRWGKLVGNHHLGVGPVQEVMVLKGVNMAFRRDAVAIPRGLRGLGAQAHFEIAMSLWARRRGWRLLYDPAIVVDHFPAPRFDADRRERPELSAVRDEAYNLVAAMLTVEPELAWRRSAYGILVGDRASPGLARGALSLVRYEREVMRKFIPSLAGQIDALRDVRGGRGPVLVSLDTLRSADGQHSDRWRDP